MGATSSPTNAMVAGWLGGWRQGAQLGMTRQGWVAACFSSVLQIRCYPAATRQWHPSHRQACLLPTISSWAPANLNGIINCGRTASISLHASTNGPSFHFTAIQNSQSSVGDKWHGWAKLYCSMLYLYFVTNKVPFKKRKRKRKEKRKLS